MSAPPGKQKFYVYCLKINEKLEILGLLDKGTFLAAVMCYVYFTVEALNQATNVLFVVLLI